MADTDWQGEDIKVMRPASIGEPWSGSSDFVRAGVFEFSGGGGHQPWLGTAALAPHASTGPHHHGRHEVAVYVSRGHGEIRWGRQLERSAEIRAGDFVYFPPYVPHQEVNLSRGALEFVVVRSDSEPIFVPLPTGGAAA
jgi:uncharacterized RmlC-like cupin family protein